MERISALCSLALMGFLSSCVVGQPPSGALIYPSSVHLVFDTPNTVRYLPGYNVYYVPDTNRDLYVVDDVWYHRADRLWYQSGSFDGPWVQIDIVQVPPPVLRLPPAYVDPRTPHEDIPWGEWKKGVRRLPPPPTPRDERPSWGDGRDRRFESDQGQRGNEDRQGGPGEGVPGRPGSPVLVVPPGAPRPPTRPEETLPPLRIGKLAQLNRLVRSGVYYIPEIDQEVFLFEENWYRHQDGAWYRASDYDGRWVIENERYVPGPLKNLSSRYREEPMERVRYPFVGLVQPPAPPQPNPPVLRPTPTPQPQPRLPVVPPPVPPARQPQPPVVAPPPQPAPEQPGRGVEQQPPTSPPGQDKGRWSRGEPEDGSREKAVPTPKAVERGLSDRKGEGAGEKDKGPSRGEGRADRLPKMDIPKPTILRNIPARGIMYLPSGPEIIYCQGGWYLRSEGNWYRSGDYDGPWSLQSERDLPQAIRVLPPGYRNEPAQDVPFDSVGRNPKGKSR